MAYDVSVNWFWAQALGAVAAYLIGHALGRRSRSWGEIALASVTLLTVGWALRRFAQDVLLQLFPLDLLVYTESTLIVPFFMMLAGVIAARSEPRLASRLAGPLLAAFGALYLCINGAWMLAPRVSLPAHHAATASEVVIPQTRPDTCVAAALATALRVLDRAEWDRAGNNLRIRDDRPPAVDTSEAEMAELADVRVGFGSTVLRALRAAQRRLAGTSFEARLHSCSANRAIALASPGRPALVTLRAGPDRTHMVALLGRTGDGRVVVANPWLLSTLGESAPGLPEGVALVSLREFTDRYTGAAIVFTDRVFGRPRLAASY